MNVECNLRSFFAGGFECSSHKRQDGKRLDLIAATAHDLFCEADYAGLRKIGMATARDGVRWHLIETRPYQYDFSSLIPMLEAARRTGMQVIWDLFHYGWPDDLDIFGAEFLPRFALFARETARAIAERTSGPPYFSPINEISFFAWAAGDFAILYPCERGRGDELKRILVRASVEAMKAIRAVVPHARFVQVDPVINVVTGPFTNEEERLAAAGHNHAQFAGWDMLAGRSAPELGGGEEYLDIVGVNYYVHNQWEQGGAFIERNDPRYRPLHEMLGEIHSRYRRPLFVAETGIEDDRRPEWLRYICDEVAQAIQNGVPVEGICLYPIVDYPGWDDERHCRAGLWGYPDQGGTRELFRPLSEELSHQQKRFDLAANSCAK